MGADTRLPWDLAVSPPWLPIQSSAFVSFVNIAKGKILTPTSQ